MSMRTFIALNLPGPERVRLYDALEPLRSKALPFRWTDPDSLHLTVKFLGDTGGDGLADIDVALRAAAARRTTLQLRIGGFGAFPSLRRAEVIWIGVAPEAELLGLQKDLELALSRLGYPREQRPYRPHITIARLRRDARAPDVERLGSLVTFDASVTVETVDLMQSHTGATGLRYEPLLKRRLGERVES